MSFCLHHEESRDYNFGRWEQPDDCKEEQEDPSWSPRDLRNIASKQKPKEYLTHVEVSRVAEETQPQGVQRLRVRGIVVLSGQQGVVGVLEGTLLHVGPQFWVWPLRDSGAETVLVDVWRVSNPKTNTRRTPSAGGKQDDKRA